MSKSTCSAEDCDRPHHAHGWCSLHYKRWRRNGDLIRRPNNWPKPLWGRFWGKVDASGDCWVWTAATNDRGYGQISAGDGTKRLLYAHRAAWELLVGPIPEGFVIDHLCRNTRCVNPDHLEPVVEAVNLRRGIKARLNEAKVQRIRQLYATGRYTQAALGRQFDIDPSSITRIVHNESWVDV